MKYFSPSLLDGSVTTAKLADAAVTRPKLSTSTHSQAGVISTGVVATVTLYSYTFFPGIEGNAVSPQTKDVQMIATRNATPDPNPMAPTFDLRNRSTTGAVNYAVAWLYVNV